MGMKGHKMEYKVSGITDVSYLSDRMEGEMSAPTTVENSAEQISDAEVEDAVARMIEGIGIDLATLRQYAERGRFDTDSQRRAWFVISGLGCA